jgi:hypothetical protein
MKKLGIVLATLVLALVVSGCSNQKESNNVKETPTNEVTQINSQNNIRPEIKSNIDNLKDYDIVDIKHMTKGIEEPQKFEPKDPKEFNAGMFIITFRKASGTSVDQVSVVCQTESKVGHLAKVVPGKTVVDGFIYYAGNAKEEAIPKLIDDNPNLKFTKDEEKYLIEHLYGRFAKKMTSSQANFVNQTKDFALAIYFNGNEGLEQFHQEQMNILSKNNS